MGQNAAAIGIDVGGTGIKGAAIDPTTGARLTSRHKVPTPEGGHPEDIAREVGAMVRRIREELVEEGVAREAASDNELPIGVTLPGVVRDGVMGTAANVGGGWIGTDAAELISAAADAPCFVVNDADAAGIAETAFGAAKGADGVTMVLTFGTGVGAALVFNGLLVPNFELGHLELDGHTDIERHISPKNIKSQNITTAEWAERTERYLTHLERLINPDRFVIGGSISKNADQYLPFESVKAPVVPAEFRNDAGIVGAAWLAVEDAQGTRSKHGSSHR